MKQKLLAVAPCLCMVLPLLPAAALAANYDGWDAGTATGVTLSDSDTVTIGTVTYTYGGDVTNTGLNLKSSPDKPTIYKAGSGYARFTPAAGEGDSATPGDPDQSRKNRRYLCRLERYGLDRLRQFCRHGFQWQRGRRRLHRSSDGEHRYGNV